MIQKETLKQVNENKLKRESNALLFEMATFQNISIEIFQEIEKKIKALEAFEVSLNKKITVFEELIQKVTSIEAQTRDKSRQHEVIALMKRGLNMDEISNIFVMPKGEIELILNLSRWGYWNDC
jgi:uncharacterized protein YhaN